VPGRAASGDEAKSNTQGEVASGFDSYPSRWANNGPPAPASGPSA